MADEDNNKNMTEETPVESDYAEATPDKEAAPDEQTHIEEPEFEAPEEAAQAETEAAQAEDEAPSEETQAADEAPETVAAAEPANEEVETPVEEKAEESEAPTEEKVSESEEAPAESAATEETAEEVTEEAPAPENPAAAKGRWYVVHTFSGHENRVAATLKQRIESEHLEELIFDILVPTQDKIEIRGGKKETDKEKIFPGYILVKMLLTDESWLAVRTTQGVTSFVGAGNKPTPITEAEVNSIVKFTSQGAQPTFKEVFMVDDTVKIIDGPFADFIGKVDSVDTEKGRLRVLVSIFGRETPVELDFLQVTKL